MRDVAAAWWLRHEQVPAARRKRSQNMRSVMTTIPISNQNPASMIEQSDKVSRVLLRGRHCQTLQVTLTNGLTLSGTYLGLTIIPDGERGQICRLNLKLRDSASDRSPIDMAEILDLTVL